MKPAALLVLTLLLTDVLHSQICDFLGKDSVVVKTAGDTLTVWDFAVCSNCATRFVTTVSRTADSIQIVQAYTDTLWMTCECIFDLSTVVTGVPSGTYSVAIYRTIPRYNMQHKLIKAVQVTVGGTATSPLSYLAHQYPCGTHPDAVQEGGRDVPERFLLAPNYPNPFNPTTTIAYELPATSHVHLSVLDLLGQLVAVLDEGMRSAGRHGIIFDATGLPSGVYFCRLQTGDHTETIRMVLQR